MLCRLFIYATTSLLIYYQALMSKMHFNVYTLNKILN